MCHGCCTFAILTQHWLYYSQVVSIYLSIHHRGCTIHNECWVLDLGRRRFYTIHLIPFDRHFGKGVSKLAVTNDLLSAIADRLIVFECYKHPCVLCRMKCWRVLNKLTTRITILVRQSRRKLKSCIIRLNRTISETQHTCLYLIRIYPTNYLLLYRNNINSI